MGELYGVSIRSLMRGCLAGLLVGLCTWMLVFSFIPKKHRFQISFSISEPVDASICNLVYSNRMDPISGLISRSTYGVKVQQPMEMLSFAREEFPALLEEQFENSIDVKYEYSESEEEAIKFVASSSEETNLEKLVSSISFGKPAHLFTAYFNYYKSVVDTNLVLGVKRDKATAEILQQRIARLPSTDSTFVEMGRHFVLETTSENAKTTLSKALEFLLSDLDTELNTHKGLVETCLVDLSKEYESGETSVADRSVRLVSAFALLFAILGAFGGAGLALGLRARNYVP